MSAVALAPREPRLPAEGLGAEVNALLDRAVVVASSDLGERAARDGVRELDRAINRLTAARLSLVAAADRARVAQGTGAATTAAWLDDVTRVGGGAAAGQVGLAVALGAGLDATREAMADGELSATKAAIVASAMAELPGGVSAADRARIERSLVADARRLPPGRLRRVARRALALVRTEAETDQHEEDLLRTQEERALDACRVTFHDRGDGTIAGSFVLPTLAASILRKAIQQLASPRRDPGGVARADDAEARGTVSALGSGTDWSQVDWANRHGRAFADLIEHLPLEAIFGQVAATLVVTIDEQRLRADAGAARLDTGGDISAGEARRLACSAGILPAVLGGKSVTIDLGRRRRYFSDRQRVALAAVYDECAGDGCDRPFAWTDLHHEKPWSASGRTDLKDAIPLCGFHHRRIHDRRYQHTSQSGPSGRKVVTFRLRT